MSQEFPSQTTQPRYWGVIPAAGVGSRFGADRPKQYVALDHRCVAEHTVQRFIDWPKLAGLVVAISAEDPYWPALEISQASQVTTVAGGKERADSVLKGLQALQGIADDEDWVLVHDMARPLITLTLLERLSAALADNDVGGILAMPVTDTVKRTGDAKSSPPQAQETVPRQQLWLAQTPQMFRYGKLLASLQQALEVAPDRITDEASALELAGYQPALVASESYNLKITRPEDLALARWYLSQHAAQGEV